MSRIKISYTESGNPDKPIRCYLSNSKVSVNVIGVNKEDAYKKMCKLVKRLYHAVPKMRVFLYERQQP